MFRLALSGVFGKKGALQDIMSVAFGSDGTTYVGTADGHIYRFAEQTMDLAVKVPPPTSTITTLPFFAAC